MFTIRYNATVSRNHVRITNAITGETLARQSPHPFSSDDCVIADYQRAFDFVGDLIKSLEGRRRLFRLWSTVDVAITGPKSKGDGDAVRRLFSNQGFVQVRLI